MEQQKGWWMKYVTRIDYTDDEPFGVMVERLEELISEAQRLERERVCGVLEKVKQSKSIADSPSDPSSVWLGGRYSALQDAIEAIKKLS